MPVKKMPTTKKRQPSRFRKAPYRQFPETCEALNITAPDLCEMMGYGRASHTVWRDAGEMPYQASLLCDHFLSLDKTNADEDGERKVIFVTRVSAAKLRAFKAAADALEIKMRTVEV